MTDDHSTDTHEAAEPTGFPREAKLPSDADATPAAAYADHLRVGAASTPYVDDAANLTERPGDDEPPGTGTPAP